MSESSGPAPHPRRLSRTRRALYIAFIAVAAVFVFAYGIEGLRFFRVPSGSMLPVLSPGDFIAAVPRPAYHRGDIVVLKDPLTKGDFLVKRIAAVAGDTVEAGLGYLSVKGKYASEPYLREPMNYLLGPLTVPDGEVLVLGDNRNESDDASRWLIDPDTGDAIDASNAQSDIVNGKPWKRTVPVSTIVGEVVYRYLPFGKIGPIRGYPLTNSAGE